MTVQTLNQQWSSDVWEHAAVIRELTTHPLYPHHPLLMVDAPHPYFSPYTVAVGGLARAFHAGPIGALQVAALVNLLLFLVGFRLFVGLLLGPRVPFFALLSVLFLWGFHDWRWSGFLNLNSFGFSLPYPSMFAMSTMLFAFSSFILLVRRRSVVWIIPLTAAAILVILSHPITGGMMLLGLGALAVGSLTRADGRLWVLLLVGAVVVCIAAVTWPYYSITDLFHQGSIYDASHAALYEDVWTRVALALVGIPLIVMRASRNPRDPLALVFVGGLAIYVIGDATGHLTLGRFVLLAVLGLQLAIADAAARLEADLKAGRRRVPFPGAVPLGIGAVLGAGLLLNAPAAVRFVPRPLLPASVRSDPALAQLSEWYSFLPDRVGQYDVVLTEGFSDKVEPTFGGKEVATSYPIPFVPSIGERRADSARFFAPGEDVSVRRRIIAKYGVSFVLVEKVGGAWDRSLRRLGQVTYEDTRFVLLRVAPRVNVPGGAARRSRGRA